MYNLIQKNGLTLNKPDEGEKTLFLDLDNKVKTIDSDGVIEVVNFTTADTPKVYKALLTQTGTDAPVATVLENTLGGTIVWSYFNAGNYIGTLAGAFTANKTPTIRKIISALAADEDIKYAITTRVTNNTIRLTTGNLDAGQEDNILVSDLIEIEVYQ